MKKYTSIVGFHILVKTIRDDGSIHRIVYNPLSTEINKDDLEAIEISKKLFTPSFISDYKKTLEFI